MSVQGVQNVCHDLRVQQMRERKVESGEPASTPQTSQYSQTSQITKLCKTSVQNEGKSCPK